MAIPHDLELGAVLHQAYQKPESHATLAGTYQGELVVIKRGETGLHREEAVMQAVDYPGIPKVVGYFEADDLDYLVMEHLAGESLSKHIQLDGGWNSHALPSTEAVRIVDGLARCFEALHKAGYLYRDLNLDHVLVSESIIGLIDHEWCIESDSVGVARIDSRDGTWETMAPEEFEIGNNMTAASNVYTLGAVLLQLMTGKNPFNVSAEEIPDSGSQRLKAQELHQRLTDINSGNLRIDDILERALQPLAVDRYQTVKAFREALKLL